ncbi:MAG: gliding motility-associated C-terminal domain-containing protein, partial [Bacteroidota bacterium]
LIAHQGSISDTIVHVITIYPIPQVNLGNDTSLCVGTNYTLNAANPGCTYVWSSGATTQTISVNSPGTYWVSVNNGHCTNSDTIQIDFHSLSVNIGNDTVICGASSYTLHAGNPGSTYLWSTGATTSSVTVNLSGYYWVSVTNAGCSGIDTIHISLSQPPIVNLGNDTVVCSGNPFNLNAAIPGGTYLWSTGATTSNISTNSSGTYWVSVSNGSCSNSDTIQINFQSLSVNLGNDTVICGASSQQLDAGNAGSNYLWSTGETTQSISVTTNGSYWVSVSNSVCTAVDTILVSFSLPPNINLGNDTILCPGNNLNLDAGNPGAYYNWSTGANTQSISVNQSGTYWLVVSIGNCFVSDTINVTVVPQLNLGGVISLCDNPEIVLSVPSNDTSFVWSTGSTDTTITITEPGSYWLSVERDNCILSDTLSVVGSVGYFYIPNAFTPNGDGLNDLYGPVCEGIPEYHFMIFSSWGELIFETNDVTQWWDGRYKGKIVKVGVYTWVLDYKTACDTDKRIHKYGIVVVVK